MNKKKLYWIELCGFNKDLEDFGVKSLINNISQDIDGFVILFANIEFFNSFYFSDKEYFLDLDDCVFGGRRRFINNENLCWTNFQLKSLIEILHGYGIKVYATVFDSMETIVEGSFSAKNEEIAQLMSDNSRNPCIDPTINLNGQSYGKFLIKNVVDVLSYYNFDGAHYADGISSWRIPLQINNYSSERLIEFANYVNDNKKKKTILKIAAENIESSVSSKNRSNKIWKNFREEWIKFCSFKWADFFNELSKAVKDLGKDNVANIAWVRDPFESIYRYGLDYRLIDFSNIDALIVNDVNRKIVPESDSCGFKISKDEYLYSNNDAPPLMLTLKGLLKNVKQYSLVPIRDNNENWDALKDFPFSFEAKCFRRNNCFYFDGDYKAINEGLLYCLSTGVSKKEWEFIGKKEITSTFKAAKPIGFCLLYSEHAFDKELHNYIQNRTPSLFWNLREMQIAGLPIYTITWLEYIEKIDMPLVCLNFSEFSVGQKDFLEKYTKPLIIFASEKPYNKPCISIMCLNNKNCYIFNTSIEKEIDVRDKKKLVSRKYMRESAESIWIKNLNYKKISRLENRKIAKILSDFFVKYHTAKDIMLNIIESNGRQKVIFDNPHSYAITAKIISGNKKLEKKIEIEANGINIIDI